MLDKVFTDLVAAQGESAPDDGWFRSAWRELDHLGLVHFTTPEEEGGSGASWLDCFALHRAAARHGVQLPLGDHDVLGRWLAARLGIDCRHEVVVVGWTRMHGGDVVVEAPWGRYADRVLVVAPGRDGMASVSVHVAQELSWEHGANLAGHPRDRAKDITLTNTSTALPGSVTDALRLRGALLRSAQICGALERSVQEAVAHARLREQFGRRLIDFQAVQSLLAGAAEEAELARAATMAAVHEATKADGDLSRVRGHVAVAKSCTAHAVGPVTRKVHQVLGAIGTTKEHDLHKFTLPALAWRTEYGGAAEWNAVLAAAVRKDGLLAAWRAQLDGRKV
ncbi:acyl-CoA dehydrogenase family protein [Nocardioides sp. AE5]|uniref:acyl-CoA dehydrogenase family protein n=1 Tax=Nocardioides sp. AE5 TaxID=2962573 RepID=UPI002881B5C9|nr:acyl-CoA dehydrogenase family protein [Nocardioides sp. AE5]MDT0203058.1 acyl-CoA dehydrogenase family protein [Nocardioides sp. AE5]